MSSRFVTCDYEVEPQRRALPVEVSDGAASANASRQGRTPPRKNVNATQAVVDDAQREMPYDLESEPMPYLMAARSPSARDSPTHLCTIRECSAWQLNAS